MSKLTRLLEIYSENGASTATYSSLSYLMNKANLNISLPYRLSDEIIKSELRNWGEVPIPLQKRIQILRQGFPSHYYYNYGLHEDGNAKNILMNMLEATPVGII